MIKVSVLCAMCISVCVISCGIISDEPDTGTSISGITITGSNTTAVLKSVANVHYNFVPNVAVYLYKKGYESIIEDSTLSNAMGEFTFSNHPLGEYVVMADSTRIKGGIKRNVVIGENSRQIDSLEVAIETYVEKSVNLQGKPVVSMKYFHFNVVSVEGIFTFAALNNHAQFVSVEQIISGESIEIQYTIINDVTNVYVTLSGTTIGELSSSSIDQSLSNQIGTSSLQSSGGTVSGVSSSLEVSGGLSSSSTLGQTVLLPSSTYPTDISSSLLSSSSEAVSINNPLSSLSLFSSISLSSSSVMSSVAELPGLLAYWKFENDLTDELAMAQGQDVEGNIAYVAGVSGNAVQMGLANQSITYDVVDSYFHIQNFTIMGWVYINAMGDYQDIWGNHNSSTGTYEGIALAVEPAGTIYVSYGTGSSWPFVRTTSNVSIQSWFHIVASYDGSELKLYVDGVLIDTYATVSTISHTAPARMGESPAGHAEGSRDCNGLLDEFKIFNRALSGAEVLSEYSLFNP